MPPEGYDPRWPDKAMFSAMLLVMGGAVGLLFQLVRPLLTVDEAGMWFSVFDDFTGYEYATLGATLLFGVLSLRRQAAFFAYLGAACAIASFAVYGLVPALGIAALAFMVLSHMEGEETSDDGVELDASLWPDKAMAASLMLTVMGAIALTQGLLILGGRFDPILLTGMPTLAGGIGVGAGLLALVGAWQVYHLRTPWLAWAAFAVGTATLGFYLIGPVVALAGMVLLGLAHKEGEFDEFDAAAMPTKPVAKGRRRRGRATPAAA